MDTTLFLAAMAAAVAGGWLLVRYIDSIGTRR